MNNNKLKWEVKRVKLSELRNNPENPRTITEEDFEDIKKSLDQDGDWSVVVCDIDGTIISGNQRYQAMLTKGELEGDVKMASRKLTEKEKRRIALRANRTKGKDNFDILANWSREDLLSGWFDEKDLDKLLNLEPNEKDDAIPEVKESIAKLGDIWQLGRHRVMCGDSTDKEAVARLMEGKKADMVFTDPPYSVNYEKKNKEVLKSKSYSKIEGDDMKVEDIAKNLWKPVFDNLAEHSKDGASIYVTMPQGGDQMMMMMMMDSWQVKHELIWVKNSPVFSMGRLDYDYMHEPILYGWKKSHQFYGNGEYKKSVWHIKRDGNKSHPTMKPVELMINALTNSSKQDDLIIDFFGGSGSTLIACEKTGRVCNMIEKDSKYVDVIIKRYEDYTQNKAVKI